MLRVVRKQQVLQFHPKLNNINRNWRKSKFSIVTYRKVPLNPFCSQTEVSNIEEDEYVNIFKNIINEQEAPSIDNIDEEEEYENLVNIFSLII